MTDQAEKLNQSKETGLDSKVREASDVETQEAGLHNKENKTIHDQTQARHKIGHSATDLMIPNQAQQGAALEIVDEEAGYILTGKGYKPLVPEDISNTYKAILQDIPEVEDPALLPDKVADATIEYCRAKGMIPDEATNSLEDLQEQYSYFPDDPSNGNDSLPTITEDQAVSYRVRERSDHGMLIESGIETHHQATEAPSSISQNPWQPLLKLTPEQRQKFIESMSNAGHVAEQSIHETSDDILRKTAQGYIDTAVGLVKFPVDIAVAAGKGICGILEFERDLMFNPERAQETAATAGDCIGKALVTGIKLWSAASDYGSEIQQKGDYGRPFQDLGNAINKWYDSLTPGDQMHAMSTVSAGFGLTAAAGQLRQLAKPGAFVQLLEEAAQAVPKNPEAQAKAADTIRSIVESVSKSRKPVPALATGSIESGGTGLGNQIDRASKALKDKFDELHHKMNGDKAFRGDHDPYCPINKITGRAKSYINEAGDLTPADPMGLFKGKPVDVVHHLCGSFYKHHKQFSPFTSFSETGEFVAKYGDKYKITADLPRLSEAIAKGEVTGVKIIPHKEVLQMIEDSPCAPFSKYNARKYAVADKEILIRGVVPKRFFTVEELK